MEDSCMQSPHVTPSARFFTTELQKHGQFNEISSLGAFSMALCRGLVWLRFDAWW
jgi:hypothetical protein